MGDTPSLDPAALKALLARMEDQCAEWERDEPVDDWWSHQRVYLEARQTIASLLLRLEEAQAALSASQAREAGLQAEGWTAGMRDAANICGSLAETMYDDADRFEAATGCEAAIHRRIVTARAALSKGGAAV